MRDTKTILLVLLSLGLVATWVYHLYDKTMHAVSPKHEEAKYPAFALRKIQDSLQQVYSITLDKLGSQLDSAKNTAGLLQGELMTKLEEINLLKTEISDLLKRKNSKKEDLDLAGRKTTEFQQLVNGLPGKNKNAAGEKNRPASVIAEQNNSPADNSHFNIKSDAPPLFTATDLKFISVKVSDNLEEETDEAEKTNKLLVSFIVKNNITGFDNAEIYAVITQPDGKVMQTDVWETSSINTHDFGKKRYTRKMRFEYQKGEVKRLELMLKPEDYEKGNYKLQVFHYGYLIGETMKTLN